MFSIFVLGFLFLNYAVWGREIYAIGGGRAEAKAAGVSTIKPLVIAFAVSGALAGLAGALSSVRLGSATPLGFDTLLLSVVTACLMGGVALEGGRGSVFGIFIGLMTLRFLVGGAASLGAPYWLQSLAIGALLMLAIVVQMLINIIRRHSSDARARPQPA